ncbi:hypothetical protein Pst134EB_001793 [Puccinia striiformis f. sp. tritici]|nr:hypothetical protein Pst134EB_001793 [Puccinia striiformis f. sp. tritici]
MYLKISLTDSVETRWTYTGSVIQGFETLTKKLDKHSHPKTPATLSVNELNSNDFLFNHMRPIVLATLHDHLTTLSLALNPLDLCNDPNSKNHRGTQAEPMITNSKNSSFTESMS